MRERKGVIQPPQHPRRVSNVLKFMQQAVDMPRHTAGLVTVADAIREDHAGDVFATGEHRGKIAALVAAGGQGDDIAFQTWQIKRAVRSLISGPQLPATEGPHCGCRAIKWFGFDPLGLHSACDACMTFLRARINSAVTAGLYRASSASIALFLSPSVVSRGERAVFLANAPQQSRPSFPPGAGAGVPSF